MDAQRRWIVSHVERCLQQVFTSTELVRDPEGDWPFRWGTAACWVQVWPAEPHLVRVFAHAAHHTRRSAKLLAELNDVNARSVTAHAYWTNGLVIVEQTLHPAGVDVDTLGQACGSVGQVADGIGAMIASVHGGATPFDPVEQTVDGGR